MDNSQQQQQQQLIQQYKDCTDTRPIRILIVNYEDDVNFALKLVLEERGQQQRIEQGGKALNRKSYKVNTFNNSISSLESFKKGSYDLAIIGVMMPEMNGFELARELRGIDNDLKICFLTAGEIPTKFGRYKLSYRHYESYSGYKGNYRQDKFIKLPIENQFLVEQVESMVM
jgi:CheY-like chemotaxis protein